jgi:hypothetical protein
MEIPLTLRPAGARALVLGISPWFRASLGLCTLVILAAILGGGGGGLFAWIVFGLAALGSLYEESWVLDAGKGELVHRYGLLLAPRSLRLPLDRVASFRVKAWVAGTLPGSADEASEEAAALRGSSPDDPRRRRREPHKKAWLQLMVVDEEGIEYLLDSLPARRGDPLRESGRRLASLAEKPFIEG